METKLLTQTKGNVIVENIEIGHIHYEYGYGECIKSEVLTKPLRDDEGYWTWQSKNLADNTIIDYGVRECFAHYAPNLYDYPAYYKILINLMCMSVA